MSISREQTLHIAKLARLKIADSEVALYTKQLSDILDLINQMQQINTEKVAELSHPQDITLRLHKDEVIATDRRDELQKLATEVRDGFYLTPKILS